MLCCRKNRKIRRKDTELCLICMDESKKIFKHSCQVCKKNAWKICKECDRQLINCPVCRTSFNRHNKITNPISIITDVNNNTTNISSFQRSGKCINNKNRCLSFCLHTWQKIKSSSFYHRLNACQLTILKVLIFLIGVIYVGKILVFLYCRSDCIDYNSKDKCYCYNITEPKSFWDLFNHFVASFLTGWIFFLIIAFCIGNYNHNRNNRY